MEIPFSEFLPDGVCVPPPHSSGEHRLRVHPQDGVVSTLMPTIVRVYNRNVYDGVSPHNVGKVCNPYVVLVLWNDGEKHVRVYHGLVLGLVPLFASAPVCFDAIQVLDPLHLFLVLFEGKRYPAVSVSRMITQDCFDTLFEFQILGRFSMTIVEGCARDTEELCLSAF